MKWLMVALLVVVACHKHEDSSERDTKGRANAKIGVDEHEASAPAGPPLRVNRRPVLFDVNGDGHDDAIVVVDSAGGSPTHAAIDGMNGNVLWKSDVLPKSSNARFVVGAFLLVPDDVGVLTAYDFKQSKPSWTASLGERVDDICDVIGSDVRVVLADNRSVIVTLSTGEQAPAPKTNPPCKPIPYLRRDAKKSVTPVAPHVGEYVHCGSSTMITSDGTTTTPDACRGRAQMDLSKLDGISASELIVVDGGFLVVGTHRPGTAYPVIGLLKGKTLVWKSDVPDGNPLVASTGDPSSTELSGTEIYVAYEAGHAAFVTAFALATGHRDWVVPASKRGPTLWASHDTVFAFKGDATGTLAGLAADTGAPRFSLGPTN